MKVGLYLPQIGPAATAANVRRFAQAAEAAGYDSLWTFDHVVFQREQQSPYPYTPDGRFLIPGDAAFLEPLTLLTFAAAVTDRTELGIAVLVLPMRQPVLHAKIMATLDALAGGRLILGAGAGWWKEEFEVLSVPYGRRGKRFEECIEVMRQLWTRDYADFDGEFYRVVDWTSNPKPPRPVPIWIGGESSTQLERAGRIGDGWLANAAMVDRLQEGFERCQQAAVAAGRHPDALKLAVNRYATISDGALDKAADDLGHLKHLGVDHAIALVGGADPIAGIEAFAARHLPALQGD
jgi:probable F420-dependent oxidoreductase